MLFGNNQLKSRLHFWKVESIGNDFPLIHLDDVREDYLPEIAQLLAERRRSVGGDGILAVRNLGQNRILLRMFNPDGSEDFCGNGLRCAAMHARALGWVSNSFTIDHKGELVRVKFDGDFILTEIDPASYDPVHIPAKFDQGDGYHREILDSEQFGTWRGSALTTGSTHVVMDWGFPGTEVFEIVSSKIENHPQFPKRTSVIWREKLDQDKIRIRIWERGVGETLGCGTGSTAAAVETMRERGYGGSIEVVNPGGSVLISADSWNAPLLLKGRAECTFEGDFTLRAEFFNQEFQFSSMCDSLSLN